MEAGFGGDFAAFQHLFYQIDTAARAVQLVAEDLVGRTGRIAEAAMHASAQDVFRLGAARQGEGGSVQLGLHQLRPDYSPAYSRPGLKIPCGSICAFNWRW